MKRKKVAYMVSIHLRPKPFLYLLIFLTAVIVGFFTGYILIQETGHIQNIDHTLSSLTEDVNLHPSIKTSLSRDAEKDGVWKKWDYNPVTEYHYNDPTVYKEDSTYYLFATEGGIDVLTSRNGVDYKKENTVLEPGVDVEGRTLIDAEVIPAPEEDESNYWMFYQVDEEEIRIAKSESLTSGWEDAGALIYAQNLSVPAVGEPSVIHDREADRGKEWKMLFTGGSGDDLTGNERKWDRTWYAYSPTGDSEWTVPDYNPVLESASNGINVQDPDFLKKDGKYYQYVNSGPQIYKFVASDPQEWTQDPEEPVLSNSPDSWDKLIFAPDIIHEPEKDRYYMVYQGGTSERYAIGLAVNEDIRVDKGFNLLDLLSGETQTSDSIR